MTEKRILIVDDEENITDALQHFLAGHGELFIAHSGQEALSLAMASNFDLVISDINMKPMSGIEFGFELRKIHPLTPIIFFSGEFNGEVTYKRHLELIGNSKFVDKSFAKLKNLASEWVGL